MQTIFALATPPGKSGAAIIRISGPAAVKALHVFDIKKNLPARTAVLKTLKYDNQIIDKSLLLFFAAPHSFTGEDVVEIHCHGSRAVIRKLLDVLSTLPDLRMAEPGEFSKRAFLNGKMDLTAAEGLADLIDAETEAQRKQAVRIMEGEAAQFYEKLRKDIVHTLSFLEAYIDFPDEDIPENVLAEIDAELHLVADLIGRQLSDNEGSEKIREGIYVTILGAPNAGKSSLMNLLAKRDVAIVSSIAGTTRDVIEVHLDIKGYSVILADTAGIREHADAIEQEGIRRTLEHAKTADVKIVVMDASAPEKDDFKNIIGDNTIILLNKSDLAKPKNIASIHGIKPIIFSVKERTGLDELMKAIEDKISGIIPAESSFVTRSRYRRHLENALEHIQRYATLKEQGLELRCEELRRASAEIGKITGKITVDEILGQIFSSFCIGK